MRKIFLLLASLLASLLLPAQDKMLDLLKGELNSQMATLQKGEYPPYYMNYRVIDNFTRTVRSSMGATTGVEEEKQIIFVPQVRIGSPEFDNFHETQNGVLTNRFAGPPTILLPSDLTNGLDAFREIIREEVNSRYKFAKKTYEAAKAKSGVKVENEDKSPDFTPAKAEKYFEPALSADKIAFDTDLWQKKLNKYTALLAENRDVIGANATLNYKIWRKYFVSTEGAEIAENRVYVVLSIKGTTMADDGMELPLNKSYMAFSLDELPSEAVIIKDLKAMSTKLSELKVAPLVQPFTGPSLLSGSASGVFFHEIFGHRVEGQKMKSDSDGQTFKNMVGEYVLPKNLSVYMDPTMKKYHGNPLNGYYIFDDQGVRGERVEVVKDGKLLNFLMTRTGLNGFLKSNGHARAEFEYDPTSRQSNLIVETNDYKSDAELRKMLIDEAKQQGKEYGYFFKAVTGGFTQTGRTGANSFNVTPLEVYRIYVDGRKDELVRGVDMIGTPLSMFSNIDAAGGDFEIFTGTCGASSGNVPVTAISPIILVNKVELQKKAKPTVTPALLPRP
ncbi:MAG TPA: TldD/PmbA family protein [Bacteroidales bacterium]|jgi:predicted Zn-dependent protease|nr:TldD/PmbA family protein [Bacteroidales bacterium]HRR49706.1 TldD/PmbA family protein [Bacteroidales bacterium]HRT33576.1 TldD/PmbA family protein [Bacteroidales bacterium]